MMEWEKNIEKWPPQKILVTKDMNILWKMSNLASVTKYLEHRLLLLLTIEALVKHTPLAEQSWRSPQLSDLTTTLSLTHLSSSHLVDTTGKSICNHILTHRSNNWAGFDTFITIVNQKQYYFK